MVTPPNTIPPNGALQLNITLQEFLKLINSYTPPPTPHPTQEMTMLEFISNQLRTIDRRGGRIEDHVEILQQHLTHVIYRIHQLEKIIMTKNDEMQAAIARLQTATAKEIKQLADAIAAQAGNGDGLTAEQAADAVAKLNAISDALDADDEPVDEPGDGEGGGEDSGDDSGTTAPTKPE